MYLKTKWFGVFLYNNEIIDKRLFPKDANEIASRLYKIMNHELLDEEKEFAKFKPVVEEERLKKIGRVGKIKKLDIKGEEYGYSMNLLREATIKVAEWKIEKEMKKRENRISQAVNALDEIIKMENIINERLMDWYSFFGEFDERDALNFSIEGSKIDEMEGEAIRKLANISMNLKNAREHLEKYIEAAMQEIAPNVTKLVGYKIASRLLAAAGSLEKLAVLPAGTIQLLGAERALFRHLKDGSKPPKHGFLFLHEMVRKAPRDKRGKIARLLATKIAIAAKADTFTHNFIAEKLIKEMERRYNEIMRG